ncbi:type IV pilus assembly protein PilV [Tamilnaduibacter salinus]|uniref:Type IV pilus assembly protein PilV n=1 Tax=Tamilnaduibacter salinus TaxID=1484056 RepID=A0A2A2HZL3_9GAMM|nr:type IV pilus modification protein PilV [Tamilnaduibacter salinus]PAV25161.1 type IV pilus modification protein PilV [Tamilnaduibacter salinus]PVY70418.1 type IV pilus assembly protein PilV [Tamilnaduibacter salinus]
MNNVKTRPGSQSGITFIEVLVTMVIVGVGLLGVAAMTLDGLNNNRSAYLRTQASLLAYDMADRIRLNSGQASSYAGFTTKGAGTSVPSCLSNNSGCSPSKLVAADKAQWASAIQGSGGDFIFLPAAQGAVTQNGDEFTVAVNWVETQWDEGAGEETDQTQTFQLTFNL